MLDVNVNLDVIKKKVQYFYQKYISVHVSLNKGYWVNGQITETGSDFFMLKDRLDKSEHVIFFLEVRDISEFKEVRV